jgi:hypothetical protein
MMNIDLEILDKKKLILQVLVSVNMDTLRNKWGWSRPILVRLSDGPVSVITFLESY